MLCQSMTHKMRGDGRVLNQGSGHIAQKAAADLLEWELSMEYKLPDEATTCAMQVPSRLSPTRN